MIHLSFYKFVEICARVSRGNKESISLDDLKNNCSKSQFHNCEIFSGTAKCEDNVKLRILMKQSRF